MKCSLPALKGSGTLFESLQAQKRNSDPASVARRQSLHEQRPQAGFIGKMWNKYVLSLSSPALTKQRQLLTYGLPSWVHGEPGGNK